MISKSIKVFVLVQLTFLLINKCKSLPLNSSPSKDILNAMNFSVDPCENFYQYSCGNWHSGINYSKREKYSQLKSLTKDVFLTINNFLENENIKIDNEDYVQQLDIFRKYYKVCLSSTFLEKSDTTSPYFLELLKKIGGFPAVEDDWKGENFNWIKMSSELSSFGCKNLLSEIIVPAYPFSFQFYKMDVGFVVGLPTNSSALTNEAILKINSEEMLRILKIYGVDSVDSEIIVKEILDFLKEIVKYNSLMDSLVETTSDLLKTDLQSDEIDEKYKFVLEEYIRIAWNITDNKTVDEIFDAQTDKEKLFLVKIVEKVNSTDSRILANYMSIKFLHYLHGDVDLIKNNKPKFCTEQIMRGSGYFTSLLYNLTISEEDQRLKAEDITILMNEILQSLQNVISEADWLDKETVEQAFLKISKIKMFIGQIGDDTLISLISKETLKLKFDGDYDKNLVELLKFGNSLKQLQFKNRDILGNDTRSIQLLNSAEVNAFYFVLDNSVYIANGILNPPVYSRDHLNAIKYGRMGYIMGHEASHAFDTLGRLFDADGDIRNWWSNTSERQYRNKSNCFRNDLNKIFVDNLRDYVNGNVTVDETLADVIGVSIAFDSFLRNAENDEVYSSFLNNNLTKEQLFFVSFAQLYCVNYSEHKILSEIDDDHPFDNIRAEAALKHLPKFAEQFKCKKGSKMNSSNTCKMF